MLYLAMLKIPKRMTYKIYLIHPCHIHLLW